MKIIATHDAEGNILGLIVNPSDGCPAVATAVEAGQFQSEIDAPSDIAKLLEADTLDEKRITKALAEYRIDPKSKAKLVKK